MNKILLIIGFVWPEPNSSAAGNRMMQLIHYFLSQDYSISFASPCAKNDNAFDLTTLGIIQISIELNNSSFDTFIQKLNPNVVLFDRFMMEEQFGWRVAEQCPDALRILDTEDLHFLRKGRHQAFKDQRPFDQTYLFNETAKREIASIHRCDLSLIISEAEMDIIKHQFKVDESLLCYLPFMLDNISKEHIINLPNFKARHHFVTIGNFLHEPNYDAVKYLKESIWPIIRHELPNAELLVYGAYASHKAQQMHNEKEGFLVKGFAPDVKTIMQNAKVCLAPLRFGAGLKGKLIDAMQNGTPCVMSSIAAEGIFGNLEPNGCIEDIPETFAQKAVELYKNVQHWKDRQSNGFIVINERFQLDKSYEKLNAIIEEIESQLQTKRLNNFTGQMLMHHTLQSTKFMSRWIEEKNKKLT